MPRVRGPNGQYVKTIEAAERRGAAAKLRASGAGWQKVADEYYGGDTGWANREVKQFWAEQPRETVEEIRSRLIATLEDLQQRANAVMDRPHYVVSEGRILVDHRDDCDGLWQVDDHGARSRCTCPKLIDDGPIYSGIAQVRALVETQLKILPGAAAPKRVEMVTDDDIAREIEQARADLQREAEQLAARRIADRAAAGDAGGTGGAAGEDGASPA